MSSCDNLVLNVNWIRLKNKSVIVSGDLTKRLRNIEMFRYTYLLLKQGFKLKVWVFCIVLSFFAVCYLRAFCIKWTYVTVLFTPLELFA